MPTGIAMVEMRRVFYGFLFITALPGTLAAQSQIRRLTLIAVQDGNKILQAYADPYLRQLADGLSDGWMYTARHEKFSVKLVSLSASVIGSDRFAFDASLLGLSPAIQVSGSPIDQTAAGSKQTGGGFVVYEKDPDGSYHLASSFSSPQGLNLRFLGKAWAPALTGPQLSIGLDRQTELMIRFVPTLRFGLHTDASAVGLGIKRSLTEWIFGPNNKILKIPPPVEVAAYAAYTAEFLNYRLDLPPLAADQDLPGNSGVDYSNQRVHILESSLILGLIASRTWWRVTPHAGVGLVVASTRLSVLGNYPVSTSSQGRRVGLVLNNPFHVRGSDDGLQASLGMNLNLYLLHINTDLILSRYSRVNLGLSLWF